METDAGTTWGEMDAICKWVDKNSLSIEYPKILELARDVSAQRIENQQKVQAFTAKVERYEKGIKDILKFNEGALNKGTVTLMTIDKLKHLQSLLKEE